MTLSIDRPQNANLKHFKPGQSGNPAGKPPGTRSAFSKGFIRDFSQVWPEEGLAAVRKMAAKNPDSFVAIAARLIPQQVAVDIQASLPGNLSPADWQIMLSILDAIKVALPDARQHEPSAVLEHVLQALQTAKP